jgi:hypothetical protein
MPTARIDQIAERLADYQEACIRVAAVHQAAASLEPGRSPWKLRCAEIVVGGCPPHWQEIEWLYPTARFLATTISGNSAAKALRSGKFYAVDAECEAVQLPTEVLQDRRQSWTEYGASEPLDWPWDEWRFSTGHHINSTAEPLISDTAPPFNTPDLALANLFGLTYHLNWSSPSQEIVVRELDRRGRIESVYVDPTYIEVTVTGSALLLSTVSLAADTPGQSRVISDNESPHVEHFETPDGTPPGAWIALVRQGQLIDRRTVDLSRLRAPEPGVRYAKPPPRFDPDTPYTAEEQAAILAAVERIKAVLPARFPELTLVQLAEFDDELAAAVEELPNLNRSAWDRLMLGTIARAVLKDVITREASDVVIGVLKVALRALPAIHGLPELPSF